MRKIVIPILSVLLILCGCGNKTKQGNTTESSPAEEKTDTVAVDEGLLNVTITLPNSFFETFDTTAEEYVNSFNSEEGEDKAFKNVVINEDGSVSITMTKAKYNEFMKEIASSLDDSLQEMIDSGDYAFESIEHDKKFENFTVRLSGSEAGFLESFMVIAFGFYGGIYQLFDGNESPQVKVQYIGADGSEVLSWDSKEAAKQQ